jgi:hypothetical protein
MKGSLVTASTAGTESSAKTISEGLHDDQRYEKRCGNQAPALLDLPHPEAAAVVHRGDRDNSRHPGTADGARGDNQLALFLPAPQQPDSRENDKCGKRIHDPVELVEQKQSRGYEESAHDEGADDPPEQHAPLLSLWNSQLGEDQQEDEDVVDRERLLEKVSRDVNKRGTLTIQRQHNQPEQQ